MSDKISVITSSDRNWEFRCNSCGQLRLSVGETQPTKCGNCGKQDLTIGRPGTLPTKEN